MLRVAPRVPLPYCDTRPAWLLDSLATSASRTAPQVLVDGHSRVPWSDAIVAGSACLSSTTGGPLVACPALCRAA